MLGALKRRVQEINQRREAKRQEEQEQRELREKVLAMLSEGKVPDLHLDISVPFRLLKNERWIFGADDVPYLSSSLGGGVRVIFGTFAISTKHLFFYGYGEHSFHIPLDKIVSVQRFDSGYIEIVSDRAVALSELNGADFVVECFTVGKEDIADFVVQLLHLLPNVDSGKSEPNV